MTEGAELLQRRSDADARDVLAAPADRLGDLRGARSVLQVLAAASVS
jgi:hypothetical protein